MESLLPLVKLVVIGLLVLLNGSCTAAGFAIVRVRATQIEPLSARGEKRARIAQHVLSHLDSYLAATQLGNTITSLGLGWLGEPFVASLLEGALVSVGITQPAVITAISFAVGFAIITFLNVVLGELAPKSLAIQQSQFVTLNLARPLHLFYLLVRPVITVLNGAANALLRIVGIEPASESDIAHSEEELRLLLGRGKAFSTTGKSLLLNVMDLSSRTVREVMVPRTEVTFLSTRNTIEENIATALENQFTRYPLCEHDLDNIVGIIHLKDLYRLKGSVGPGSKLLEIKRDAMFVPETTPLEKMLNMFLARKNLMAIVVDEYGGTAGLITLENVLEEVVGEIRDEFDVEPMLVHKVSESEFIVDGTMPLHEFARMFDIVPESRDVVTVGGYAIQLLGSVPEKGATLDIGGWHTTIEAVEDRKVKSMRIKRRNGRT